jgi:uncharacterized protein (DUF1778 family)
MATVKRKPGRPRLAASERRAEVVTLRLQPVEREAVERAAKRAGVRLSDWMRDALLAAAGHRVAS